MVDTSQIQEHMEVVANDGQHIGTVDHLDGQKGIKLTKNDPASNGEHHWISQALIASIDNQVHLSCSADQAMREETSE